MSQSSRELESRLEILKKVASAYADDSQEYATVKLAAEALLFIETQGRFAEFVQGVKAAALPLTEEQIAHLKSMGCEVSPGIPR